MADRCNMTIQERFDNIGFAVSRATGCHLWLGSVYQNGYGRFVGDDKKIITAHVFA